MNRYLRQLREHLTTAFGDDTRALRDIGFYDLPLEIADVDSATEVAAKSLHCLCDGDFSKRDQATVTAVTDFLDEVMNDPPDNSAKALFLREIRKAICLGNEWTLYHQLITSYYR